MPSNLKLFLSDVAKFESKSAAGVKLLAELHKARISEDIKTTVEASCELLALRMPIQSLVDSMSFLLGELLTSLPSPDIQSPLTAHVMDQVESVAKQIFDQTDTQLEILGSLDCEPLPSSQDLEYSLLCWKHEPFVDNVRQLAQALASPPP